MNDDLRRLIINVVTTMIPLFLAIGVHEYAHVAMARFLGDRTGEKQGRLTLNPLAHLDPMWTVALPLFLVVTQTLAGAEFAIPFFAAGRPAPFNPNNFTRKISARKGELLVAAAGPASNVVLALLTVGVVGLIAHWVPPTAQRAMLLHVVISFLLLNITLAIFNMVPVPPLDGSKVLAGALPYEASKKYAEVSERASWFLFIAVFLLAPRVLSPLVMLVGDHLLRIVA